MDGGAWWATVHGGTKSRTRLSDFPLTFHFRALEKEMATHSSVLAWRIPGTGEPGGLPSMASHRVGQDWSDLAAAAGYNRFSSAHSCLTFCDPHAAHQASLSITSSQSLLKLMSIESDMPANILILCHPLLLLPLIFPSISIFSSELALSFRWPKYWSFSNHPSNEYSELIAFRIDWFDHLAVQRNFKSLLQHHNLKASILWYSVLFCCCCCCCCSCC